MSDAGRVKALIRRALVTAGAALAAVAVAGCDATSGPVSAGDGGDAGRQVTVVGSGEVQGAPDTLTVNVAMEFIAPDVTGAMNQTNERQQAVIDALLEVGVDRSDVTTTQVSLQPQFDGPEIVGYRSSNAIDVKIRRLDRASDALALIVETGGDATRINSVNYSIDDNSPLVRDARARAFEDAQDRAQQYAQLSGLSLGSVVSITEAPGDRPPTPLPGGMRAEVAAVPLEPGQQTVSFSVTVIWELT
ncbi:SIMPL domain-containing protein [Mycolicibacterium thermoresistibile]